MSLVALGCGGCATRKEFFFSAHWPCIHNFSSIFLPVSSLHLYAPLIVSICSFFFNWTRMPQNWNVKRHSYSFVAKWSVHVAFQRFTVLTTVSQMLRCSARRLGHQLIKEPLGHEATTFVRGERTRHNALQHVYGLATFCGVGCVFALFSFVSGQRRVQTIITADGSVTKGTCPTKWWNF